MERFQKQVDEAYQQILTSLDQNHPDLPALGHEYQQIRQRDYFHSDIGRMVREKLLAAREGER